MKLKQTKKCERCGEEKKFTEYYMRKDPLPRMDRYCKSCCQKRMQANRRKRKNGIEQRDRRDYREILKDDPAKKEDINWLMDMWARNRKPRDVNNARHWL